MIARWPGNILGGVPAGLRLALLALGIAAGLVLCSGRFDCLPCLGRFGAAGCRSVLRLCFRLPGKFPGKRRDNHGQHSGSAQRVPAQGRLCTRAPGLG
jgi:hypothetical protein